MEVIIVFVHHNHLKICFFRRFRCVIGFVLLLILEKSESSTYATCVNDGEVTNSIWSIQEHNFCISNIHEIDNENFTFPPETKSTISLLLIDDEPGVKFLPANFLAAIPDVEVLQIFNCSVAEVNENHFKGLSKLRILILAFNKIEHIAGDAFADLVSLESLSLAYNRIKFFWESIFAPLTALKMLSLESNEIQNLQPKIFRSHKNLEGLRLSNNEIMTLDGSIFETLMRLKYIYLNDNKLEKFEKSLFQNNSKLERIWLNDNRIKFIDADMFDHLSNLESVNLRQNVCIDDDYAGNFDNLSNDLQRNCTENSTEAQFAMTSDHSISTAGELT